MNNNYTNAANLSAEIKRYARELGFSKVGIAKAEQLAERSHLNEWLARGYHGEMAWMTRDPEQRTDPKNVFPDARSVVVVALNYYTPHEHEVSTTRVSGWDHARSVTGKISRYAWGDDYHEIVGGKLRELLQWIQQRSPEAEGKVCVDIQPIMDKAWAVHAGLGWVGKHTNVITQEYGSWVFLGELLLNLELEYDREEVADQCGSCTLCIDECPTGAIVEPYVLNSNLCISHATIESRAPEMRAEVVANLEGWLYGCDICQDVCPWNQMVPATDESRFEPRPGNVNASLSEILELTPETYASRFRHSAIKRAKLFGLQRNARTLQNRSR